MLRVKQDHFNFQNSFWTVKGVCVLGCCCSVTESCPTLWDPWIEGVYSERRNGQMQRHEIKALISGTAGPGVAMQCVLVAQSCPSLQPHGL